MKRWQTFAAALGKSMAKLRAMVLRRFRKRVEPMRGGWNLLILNNYFEFLSLTAKTKLDFCENVSYNYWNSRMQQIPVSILLVDIWTGLISFFGLFMLKASAMTTTSRCDRINSCRCAYFCRSGATTFLRAWPFLAAWINYRTKSELAQLQGFLAQMLQVFSVSFCFLGSSAKGAGLLPATIRNQGRRAFTR